MPKTPTRKITVLGSEREIPAAIAERMVREGRAQFSEIVGPETATAEAPETAVKPASRRRTAKRTTKKKE